MKNTEYIQKWDKIPVKKNTKIRLQVLTGLVAEHVNKDTRKHQLTDAAIKFAIDNIGEFVKTV